MKDVVRDYIMNLIEKKAKLPSGDLDSFDYLKSGYIDSIGIIKFVLDIEAKFEVEISESDMQSDRFRTVGGLVKIVECKLAAAGKS